MMRRLLPGPGWFIGDRGRRIAHAGTWSLVAKASAAAHLFLSVPFVLAALGPARFGAWATLVALVAFAGFLDFGMGNGAMNMVAATQGRGQTGDIRRILDEAWRTLVRIGAALLAATAVAAFLLPWHRFLGMPEAMAAECRAAAVVVLASIAVSVPLNLANRIHLGLGRGERTFRWQALGQWLALAAVVAAAKAGASLAVLTAASVATPLLASLANSALLWREFRDRSQLPPDVSDQARIRRRIRTDGMAFFGLQLAASLAFSADLPLISSLASAREAGQYAIAQRLFSMIPLALSLVWAPLWPIYRHALSADDHGWVGRTFRRSMVAATLFALFGSTAFVTGFRPISALWLHQPLAVAPLLLMGMAVWAVLEAMGTALSTLLNAANVLRYQLATSAVFALACVAGKAWVIDHGHVAWTPWVTASTYLAVNLVGLAAFRPAILSTLNARSR